MRRWRVHWGALVADLLRQGYRHVRVVDYKPALGGNQMVTINQLVDIAEEIAGIKLDRHYKLSASKGVNGRNSDNTLIKKLLGWEPSYSIASWPRKNVSVDLRPNDGGCAAVRGEK